MRLCQNCNKLLKGNQKKFCSRECYFYFYIIKDSRHYRQSYSGRAGSVGRAIRKIDKKRAKAQLESVYTYKRGDTIIS